MTTTPSSSPTTPAQIRDILCEEPSRVSDAQLIALLLGIGTRRKARGELKKTWNCVELGEALYHEAGGRLSDFVGAVRRDAIDLGSFGIGKTLGARLAATAELAHRWRRGFRQGGNAAIRPEVDLEAWVLERQEPLSEGELLALLVESYGRGEDTRRMLEYFGSPQALVESLELGTFTQTRKGSRSVMALADTGIKIKIGELGRLLSALELARRYRLQATVECRKLSPGVSGLSSVDLVTLLDTERRLDRPLREMLVSILRSHPDVARDFESLDRLAAEAGVEDLDDAVEAHQMFEELVQRESWSDPAEVLGPRVPFARLLKIAEAKIGGVARPPKRFLQVQELLLAAQRQAVEGPVSSFVDMLRELAITDEGAETAFEAARRRYFEGPAAATKVAAAAADDRP